MPLFQRKINHARKILGKEKREGSIMDLLFLVIPLGLMLMLSVVAYKIFSTFTETAAETDAGLRQGMLETGLGSIAVLDQGIMLLFGGLTMTILYLAWRLNYSKLFVVPGIMVLGLFTYIFAQMANVIGEVTGSSQLGAASNEFSMSVVFFNNLPAIGVIVGTLILLFMVTNIGRGGGTA